MCHPPDNMSSLLQTLSSLLGQGHRQDFLFFVIFVIFVIFGGVGEGVVGLSLRGVSLFSW